MTLSSDISTTSTALSDIKSAIIAKGVTPTGNITTYATAIGNIPTIQMNGREVKNGVYQVQTESFTLSFSDNITDVGLYAFYYMLQSCTSLTSINLPSLTTVSGQYAFYNAFSGCANLTTVNLPNLITVSGNSAFSNAFYNCTSITSVDLSNLTTISGSSSFYGIFYSCNGLTSINFPKLTTISGTSSFSRAFYGCSRLSSIYFNALKTTSFGSYVNQFQNMMQSTGTSTTHTLHFPSNMQSTISGLSGYPLFGGTSGYVTLSFDLPATS